MKNITLPFGRLNSPRYFKIAYVWTKRPKGVPFISNLHLHEYVPLLKLDRLDMEDVYLQ